MSDNLSFGSCAKHLPNSEAMVYKIATWEAMNQNENSTLCITISAMRAAKSIVLALVLHVGTKLDMAYGGQPKQKLSTEPR